jgi:hypothetical protein
MDCLLRNMRSENQVFIGMTGFCTTAAPTTLPELECALPRWTKTTTRSSSASATSSVTLNVSRNSISEVTK